MKENTSIRLKKLMKDRNLKQVDILNLVKPYCVEYGIKMNKSDISQYVNGVAEPSQKKLVILGRALNVTEAWLMGLDVIENNLLESAKRNKATEKELSILKKFDDTYHDLIPLRDKAKSVGYSLEVRLDDDEVSIILKNPSKDQIQLNLVEALNANNEIHNLIENKLDILFINKKINQDNFD